jgi:hypothetical protein
MKTTKNALAVALGLIALVAPGQVLADTIFTAAGAVTAPGAVLGNAITISGTVSINVATGVIDAVALVSTSPLNSLNLDILFYQGVAAGMSYELIPMAPSQSDELFLIFPTATLVGYAGGPLCSLNYDPGTCSNIGLAELPHQIQPSQIGKLTDFILTPQSTPTPEPTTSLLLGTGLVALTVMGWRRKRLAVGPP